MKRLILTLGLALKLALCAQATGLIYGTAGGYIGQIQGRNIYSVVCGYVGQIDGQNIYSRERGYVGHIDGHDIYSTERGYIGYIEGGDWHLKDGWFLTGSEALERRDVPALAGPISVPEPQALDPAQALELCQQIGPGTIFSWQGIRGRLTEQHLGRVTIQWENNPEALISYSRQELLQLLETHQFRIETLSLDFRL